MQILYFTTGIYLYRWTYPQDLTIKCTEYYNVANSENTQGHIQRWRTEVFKFSKTKVELLMLTIICTAGYTERERVREREREREREVTEDKKLWPTWLLSEKTGHWCGPDPIQWRSLQAVPRESCQRYVRSGPPAWWWPAPVAKGSSGMPPWWTRLAHCCWTPQWPLSGWDTFWHLAKTVVILEFLTGKCSTVPKWNKSHTEQNHTQICSWKHSISTKTQGIFVS